MGYDGLYKCGVIAEDEPGTVSNDDESQGAKGTFNPPPVWTILGWGLAELHGATTGYLRARRGARPGLSGGDVRGPRVGVLCLGQIFIILLSQLTCYHHSFMILAAPLTRAKKGNETPLLGFAAPSQLVWITFFWNDDKCPVLTLLSLLFCLALFCAFAPTGGLARLFGRGSDEARPRKARV